MLDFSHIPVNTGSAEIYYFQGPRRSGGANDITYTFVKPRGKSMIDILAVGSGGNGGQGAVGANSTAAGGGGGGSGAQTRLIMPLHLLPDVLYLCLEGYTASASIISIAPNVTSNNVLAYAANGGVGGAASGATAGTAGSAGAVATASNMPLGWAFATSLVGQAGIAGGSTGSGASLTLPTTGLRITGGTGGGGLPAAAASGTAGGGFTVAGAFPAHPGGATQATATNPGNPGSQGKMLRSPLAYNYGGTGGGSSHGSATGAGLFGGDGGAGAPGCGGGGGGGCLTGGVAGKGGEGGTGFFIITVW